MIVYVNGDSHSCGTDAGGAEFSYGNYLAKSLNAEFVCDAVPGGSNFRILRTTRDYLKSNKPDLIVIGWSTWEREEWLKEDGSFFQVAAGTAKIPWSLQLKFKEWVTDATEPDFIRNREQHFHNEIYKFHLELKNLSIPHLFFNTYLYFQYTVDLNLDKFDWGNNYISPYKQDGTFYYWLINQGFVPNKQYHFDKDGQEAWANKLLKDLTHIW